MQFIGDPTIFVFALLGAAISSWVMMRFKWLPDPPPPVITSRYLTVLIAGVISGAVGGYLGMAGSNPMPGLGIVGSGSLSMIVAGGIAILGGSAKR
jgi:hypothetical protein